MDSLLSRMEKPGSGVEVLPLFEPARSRDRDPRDAFLGFSPIPLSFSLTSAKSKRGGKKQGGTTYPFIRITLIAVLTLNPTRACDL